MKKKSDFNIFEFFITAAIILVIVHTFLEDFALLSHWSQNIRDALMILGFCFDLFFTIEFLSRLYLAQNSKGMAHYFVHQYGWVDFLASVPLLMLSSGPQFVTYFVRDLSSAGLGSLLGFITLLKLIKTIRIARILRLLRIIKVFRNIKYADSPMAQRHVAKIITIAVSVIVAGVFCVSLVTSGLNLSANKDGFESIRQKYLNIIAESAANGMSMSRIVDSLLITAKAHDVVMIQKGDQVYFSKYNESEMARLVFGEDLKEARLDASGIKVVFDTRGENITLERIQAQDSLTYFCIVLLVVIAYLLFYSPHFAMTVSDPVNVMKQGMAQKEYNLEVKIPELFEDDDIFQLAKLFNEKYLPLKDRMADKPEDKSSVLDLGLADIQSMMDDEF
ncbi:MAG: ion transporter [Spirochaetales bacterium]|nr:ion transporter [Spirochaetales bacterium]